MDVLLERIEPDSVASSEAEILVFQLYRFTTNKMAIAKGAQLSPPFSSYLLEGNRNMISHSAPLRLFSAEMKEHYSLQLPITREQLLLRSC